MRLKIFLVAIGAAGAIVSVASADDGSPINQGANAGVAKERPRPTSPATRQCAREERTDRTTGGDAARACAKKESRDVGAGSCQRLRGQLVAETERMKSYLREQLERIGSLPKEQRAQALERLKAQAEKMKTRLRASVERAKEACASASGRTQDPAKR